MRRMRRTVRLARPLNIVKPAARWPRYSLFFLKLKEELRRMRRTMENKGLADTFVRRTSDAVRRAKEGLLGKSGITRRG